MTNDRKSIPDDYKMKQIYITILYFFHHDDLTLFILLTALHLRNNKKTISLTIFYTKALFFASTNDFIYIRHTCILHLSNNILFGLTIEMVLQNFKNSSTLVLYYETRKHDKMYRVRFF